MDGCACWKCLRPEATHEDYLRYVDEVVDGSGWMVQAVLSTRHRAPFAYTVGLTARGLPELVVTGRWADVTGSMLDAIAGYTVDRSEIRPGEVMHLGDVHLEAIEVLLPDVHLLTAVAMYGQAVRGLQMVWADDRGRLPREPGHRTGRGGQPVLGPREARPD